MGSKIFLVKKEERKREGEKGTKSEKEHKQVGGDLCSCKADGGTTSTCTLFRINTCICSFTRNNIISPPSPLLLFF